MSRLNSFPKDFKRNVRFDAEITVCHMRDTVLDEKLQQKIKMCLLIRIFENKQFSLSHTSATFLNVVGQEGSTRRLGAAIFPSQPAQCLQDLEQVLQMASLLKGVGKMQVTAITV